MYRRRFEERGIRGGKKSWVNRRWIEERRIVYARKEELLGLFRKTSTSAFGLVKEKKGKPRKGRESGVPTLVVNVVHAVLGASANKGKGRS